MRYCFTPKKKESKRKKNIDMLLILLLLLSIITGITVNTINILFQNLSESTEGINNSIGKSKVLDTHRLSLLPTYKLLFKNQI